MSETSLQSKKGQKIQDKDNKKNNQINEKDKKQNSKEETFYIVEKILDHKKVKNKELFLVKWEGYSETTWEPKSNLSNVKPLITLFLNSKNEKNKQKNNRIDSQESISNEKDASVNKKASSNKKKNQNKQNDNGKEKSSLNTGEDGSQQQIFVKEEEQEGPKEKQSPLKSKETSNQESNSSSQSSSVKEESQEQNEKKSYDDAEQQMNNNRVSKKRNHSDIDDQIKEKSNQESTEETPRKTVKATEITGCLEYHVPQRIAKAVYKEQKFQYHVQWKQTDDVIILPSLVTSQELQKRYSDIIVGFYEDKALKKY